MGQRFVFGDAPCRVYWEITRACDLACRHCRAEAAPTRDMRELDTRAGIRLLGQLAASDPKPHVVLTGGDPLKRDDLFELIAAGRGFGLGMSVSPSATPLLTAAAIARLKAAGVEAISLSIDCATAERHDAIRGVQGCMARTMTAARQAHDVGLPFQVNTLVCEETVDDLPAIETLARSLGAARWSLFFLVTVGRGAVLSPITPERTEELLGWLADRAREPGMVITTTEAPHFRRIMLERRDRDAPRRDNGHGAGIRDGNGVMFVSHDGEVYPSGFLPISAGNVKERDPLAIYRDADLFRVLRAADAFGGRCGVCSYRQVCGGSRARAWAKSGDPLDEDPLCTYDAAAALT